MSHALQSLLGPFEIQHGHNARALKGKAQQFLSDGRLISLDRDPQDC